MDGLQTRLLKTKYMLTSAAKYWWHNADLQSIMQIASCQFLQAKGRPSNGLSLKNPFEGRGLHPLGAPPVHPMEYYSKPIYRRLLRRRARLKRLILNRDAGARMEITFGSRPSSRLSSKNLLKGRGLHPLGAPPVHPMKSRVLQSKMPTSKAQAQN